MNFNFKFLLNIERRITIDERLLLLHTLTYLLISLNWDVKRQIIIIIISKPINNAHYQFVAKQIIDSHMFPFFYRLKWPTGLQTPNTKNSFSMKKWNQFNFFNVLSFIIDIPSQRIMNTSLYLKVNIEIILVGF